MISYSLQIMQYTFNNDPTSISKSMHKISNNFHYITYIKPGESNILDSTNDMYITCRIIIQSIRHHGHLRRKRGRSINRFTRRHTGSIKKCQEHTSVE